MSQCNEIQKIIAELGLNDVIESPKVLEHIESCQACQEYQQACQEMNLAMSGIENNDADDALVESTLNSILSIQQEKKKPKSLLNTQWASALAASFVLVSLIALFPYNSVSNFGIFSDTQSGGRSIEVSEEEKQKIKKRKEALSKTKQDSSNFEFIEVDVVDEVNQKQRRIPKKSAPPSSRDTIGQLGYGLNKKISTNMSSTSNMKPDISNESLNKSIKEEFKKDAEKELAQLSSTQAFNSPQEQRTLSIDEPMAESEVELAIEDRQRFSDESDLQEMDGLVSADSMMDEFKRVEKSEEDIRLAIEQRRNHMREEAKGKNQDKESLEKIAVTGSRINRADNDTFQNTVGMDAKRGRKDNEPTKSDNRLPQKLTPAQEFLRELNSLNNVTYQNATGYWANNYLPGDASMRLLGAELLKNDVDIQSIVEQNRQPFDFPSNSALEVYLSSDKAFVNAQEPTRMKLQVGIQASNRKGGHRSTMNIGLVFDVNEYNADSNKKLKALLLALLKAKQAGDKISVTLTGVNGGQVIEASEFRYGTIQALMNSLNSKDNRDQNVTVSLHEAINLASVNLQQDDDPTASLGSSVVILVSDKSINGLEQIESTVHANAINGITLSTISLNSENQQLSQLALAGQGHSRIVHNENDAKRVVDEEILASSRAVARALRLRIRLANGVKLIKVLGSYNLNEKQAQRVRDAENSLDQRLSKNLGIQADRGDDEEGIQIVIPSFYAGDTHIIILDVVVNNPGAVADVTMRYKDLLYLRNAVSRKQLNLGNDNKSIGPLQLNVIKNVLASRFTEDIKQAATWIKNGNNDEALLILKSLQELYKSMRHEFPAWNSDSEILKDEKLIQQYIELINQTAINNAPKINYIVNSLQYISWRKNITQSK